jgi:hypothetical protein
MVPTLILSVVDSSDRYMKSNGEYLKGSNGCTSIQLARSRSLKVDGDRVKLRVLLGTNLGTVVAVHEFLILDNDTEKLVMRYNRVFGSEMTRILDIEIFGISQPSARIFPQRGLRIAFWRNLNWMICHFNPQLDQVKDIVRENGVTLFQPDDQVGLRVDLLKLQVRPSATFKI